MSVAVVVIGGLVALGWTALGLRLIALARGPWCRWLQPVAQPPGEGPTVAAIVPARNEEAHVAATVVALRAQEYDRLTLNVVDDQSTDGTATILQRIADEPGGKIPLRLIQGTERPEGWVGKTWAVHQGAAGTTAEWLWFVDADMGLHPLALASALAESARTGADCVSLMPGVRCQSFWQGAIGVALAQILGHLYPLGRVNDPERPEAIAAGGFILVRRTVYERAGGHLAVRREIVEDIQLARRIKATGGKLAVRLAPELAWTHMYGRFGDIWRGLRKNAYAGMDYMPHKYVFGGLFGLLMAWAPLLALAHGLYWKEGPAVFVGVWGILAQAVASAPSVVFLKLPWPFALTMPAGITAYIAIATASVWHHHRGRILWKGRAIPTSTVVEPANPTRFPGG